ncbi:MAG: cytochrome P450 [Actinophytocola sp.]|uniref:cytochrome P450 n=1 Tax=Actinophytocola sp. TaxID=1872138 RepID=UPI00132A4D65|nr:cytochrome P450 [Actinophytocola sp.]MPZ85185.1 cytochrome P450 [Actinophytocola sp.]
MDIDYNPFDYEFQADPYPTYARMQDEAPVYYSEEFDLFALTRHADVGAALRDSDRLSNSHGPLLERDFWKPDAAKMHSMVAMDPPEHTQFRALVSDSFTPRKVAALEPRIRQLARRNVEAAVERGKFDFVVDLSKTIPMATISMVVGVPEADQELAQRLLDGTVHREDGAVDISPKEMKAFYDLTEYYVGLVAEKRRVQSDDLLSSLVSSEVDGRGLTDHEIVAFLHLLGGASTQTTIDLISNAWYWAWRNPEQRKVAMAGGIRGWVEETLRYDSAVQMVNRHVNEDIVLHDVTIPQGAQLVLLLGAANRDGRVFPEPHKYDVSRDATGVLSFSKGPHTCLGNLLGRLQARIVLEELAARVADYDIDAAQLKRVHRATVRGFTTMTTEVTPIRS